MHLRLSALLCLTFLRLPHPVTLEPAECENWRQVFPDCACLPVLDEDGEELPSVALVDCSSKSLTSVPKKISSFPRTLYELRLSDNQITTLPNNAFQGVKIRHLNLKGNSLGDIHENAFNGTENEITILNIEGNSVIPPQRNALRKLINLEELTMKNYNVTHLSDTQNDLYFHSFRNLQKLTLDNWGIKSIGPHAFLAAGNRYTLRSISLLHQKLLSLPIDVLASIELQNLESLRISHTTIRAITAYAFSNLKNIKEIMLSDNEIASIEEDSFINVGDTLEKLDFSNNFLGAGQHDELPQLKDLQQLKHLSLQHNEFKEMPKMEHLGNGQAFHLDFRRNELSTLSADHLASYIARLQGLDLTQNKIAHIDDDTFSGVSELKLSSFILTYQEVAAASSSALAVPTSLTNAAKSLTYLDLSGQNLQPTRLWQIVGQLRNLQTLYLNNVELRAIPDFTFENLTGLKKLELGYNPISSPFTDKTFVGLRTIETLDLRSTNIAAIPACFLHNHIGNLALDLGFNEIACDCTVKTLLEKTQNGTVIFPDTHSIPTCSNNGLLLTQIDPAVLNCDSEECVNYYTTPSPNQPVSSESTIPTIQIRILSVDINSIKLAWDLSNSKNLQRYRITVFSSNQMIKDIDSISVSTEQQNIQDLTADTYYQVCVYAYFSSIPPVSACEIQRTLAVIDPHQDENNDDSDCEFVKEKGDQQNLTQTDQDNEPSLPIPSVQIRLLAIDKSSMNIAWDITNTTELQYYKVTVSSTHTTKNYHQQPFKVTKKKVAALTPNTHDINVCVYAYFTSGRPVSLCESVRTATDPK